MASNRPTGPIYTKSLVSKLEVAAAVSGTPLADITDEITDAVNFLLQSEIGKLCCLIEDAPLPVDLKVLVIKTIRKSLEDVEKIIALEGDPGTIQ